VEYSGGQASEMKKAFTPNHTRLGADDTAGPTHQENHC